MTTAEDRLRADSVTREGEVYDRTLTQAVHQDNRDIQFNGRVRLRNHTTAPSKGRVGEVIMLNGVLSGWDSDISEWVAASKVSSPQGNMRIYIGEVDGSDGSSGTPFPAGWSSSRTSTGVYVVTHNFDDSNSYIVAPAIDDTDEDVRLVYERDSDSFDIEITDKSTGNPTDADFTFAVFRLNS